MPAAKPGYTLIEKMDYSSGMPEREYEETEFRQCTFGDLNNIHFTDCVFTSCNLSNAVVKDTKMQDLTFTDCKMIGINFYEVKDFGFAVNFQHCQLNYASFDKKKMNKSVFSHCRLHGANFSSTDLSKTKMEHCDLLDAIFMSTNLSGADFSTNQHFIIDPTRNNVKKAVFAHDNVAGLLAVFNVVIR